MSDAIRLKYQAAAFFDGVQLLIESAAPLQCRIRTFRDEGELYRDVLLQRAGVNVVLGEGLELYIVEDPASKFGRRFTMNFKHPCIKDANRYDDLLTRVVALVGLREWRVLLDEKFMTCDAVLSEVHDEVAPCRRKCISCFLNCEEGIMLWYDTEARQHVMEIHYCGAISTAIVHLSPEKADAVYAAAKRVLHQQVRDAQKNEHAFSAFLAAEDHFMIPPQVEQQPAHGQT